MSNPFDRNPFRLPPPWNPGYALPQNVDDEGLERHAYTTAWAPRGSFDNPKVGTAGYAVPQYVKDEGYGVGAMVTRWAPRGSYPGPKVPFWLDKQSAKVVGRKRLPGGATQLQIQTMAGVEISKTGKAPFTNYGMKSAAALIETVKMMPPAMRTAQLRKAMEKIDPNLYARSEKLATAESKAGVPADVALERGIAAAMSQGIASELVELGRGKKPAKKSQLGAVCYGCATALGATGDTKAGFCWIPATATVPGHWERMQAGQDPSTCIQTEGGSLPTVRVGSGTTVAPPPETQGDQKFLLIGPFMIPVSAGQWRDHRPLTGDKKAWVDANVAQAAKAGGISVAEMQQGRYPFVRFKSDTGEPWGLYYEVKSDGTTLVSYHKETAEGLEGLGGLWGFVKDIARRVGGAIKDVFKKIWAGIKWVAVTVVDFVKDAAEWIKDKACDLFSSPLGQVAGAAAGASVGGAAGAQAGAMGAQIAAQACASQEQQTAPPVTPPQEPSMMPLLLVGGAGIAALLILGKKKH